MPEEVPDLFPGRGLLLCAYHLVMKTVNEMRALLGKDIQVTFNKQEIVRGKLVGFGNDGDFEILCSDGMIHYCWPLLDVTEL